MTFKVSTHPDCQMPDGAQPCKGFELVYEALRDAEAEVERLRAALEQIAQSPVPGGGALWERVDLAREVLGSYEPSVPKDMKLRAALEPFAKVAGIIARRPGDYGNKIVTVGGLADAFALTKTDFQRAADALVTPDMSTSDD